MLQVVKFAYYLMSLRKEICVFSFVDLLQDSIVIVYIFNNDFVGRVLKDRFIIVLDVFIWVETVHVLFKLISFIHTLHF